MPESKFPRFWVLLHVLLLTTVPILICLTRIHESIKDTNNEILLELRKLNKAVEEMRKG